MPTTVVHVNNPDGFDVYVGRAEPRAKNPAAHTASPWANRHRVKQLGLPVALSRYRADLAERLRLDPEGTLQGIAQLVDKRLACWCAPKDEILLSSGLVICHAQILALYADQLLQLAVEWLHEDE